MARRPSTAWRSCSKLKLDEVTPGLPGDDADDHARFLEATVSTAAGALRVACLYLPNGNPPDTEKYTYKLKWMERLSRYARERLELEEPLVLAGDYNVIPTEKDVHDPAAWIKDALFLPKTRAAFRSLAALGLTDALRATTDAARALHVLGLSGRSLAEELGHPDRSPDAVAAGGGPAGHRRHRQACAVLGAAVRPRPGLDRPRYRGGRVKLSAGLRPSAPA